MTLFLSLTQGYVEKCVNTVTIERQVVYTDDIIAKLA